MRDHTPVNAESGRAPDALILALAVWFGGGLGTLLRFELAELWPVDPTSWPWHTFIANVVACALLSFVLAHRARGRGSDRRTALIGTGFCGGLSTFSALQLELFQMFDAGSWLLAVGYLAASITVGITLITLARRRVARGEDVA